MNVCTKFHGKPSNSCLEKAGPKCWTNQDVILVCFHGYITQRAFNNLSVFRLSKAADMDHHWVAKAWLSDVGLPQYSQAFHNHLVDGRLLNSLTRRDLERHLNITKKFHQVSLLLGIELLHLLNFDKEVSEILHRVQRQRTAVNTLGSNRTVE